MNRKLIILVLGALLCGAPALAKKGQGMGGEPGYGQGMGGEPGYGRGMERGDGPAWFHPGMAEELGLSDAQKKLFQEERQKGREEHIDMMAEKKKLELRLHDALFDRNTDNAKLDDIRKQLVAIEDKLLQKRISHMRFFVKNLTDTQVEKIKTMPMAKGKPGRR